MLPISIKTTLENLMKTQSQQLVQVGENKAVKPDGYESR